MRTRIAVTSVIVFIGVLAFPQGAQAVGELTPGGCVDDNDDGPDVCAQSVNGLFGAAHVTVSPDGKSVYAVGSQDHAVVRFNRGPTGALTPAGCIDDNDVVADACAVSVNGLGVPTSVAVSPDGKSVYVTGAGDDALVRFNRDASGALTPAGCVDDNDDGPDVCALSVNGMNGANSVAVSPDGTSVYVTGAQDDAVVRFNRSSTGALVPGGCVDDNDEVNDLCALSVNGLNNAGSVTVSPDGKSVYVSSFGFFILSGDNAIVRFNRDTTTGALTSAGCIDDDTDGPDTCAQTVPGLGGASEPAVSPDGTSLYIVASGDGVLTRFVRSPVGALTPAGCVGDNDGTTGCTQSVNGLFTPRSVVVSSDGRSVYATSGDGFMTSGDDAVVRFNRAPDGSLASGGCIDDNDTGEDVCAQSVNGLNDTSSVAVSPDGSSVYVAAVSDNAIVRFNRTP